MAGIPVLAAVSAPSSLAVDLASGDGADVGRASCAATSMNVYSGAERIASAEDAEEACGQGSGLRDVSVRRSDAEPSRSFPVGLGQPLFVVDLARPFGVAVHDVGRALDVLGGDRLDQLCVLAPGVLSARLCDG